MDGVIGTMLDTGHACALTSSTGVEILIHAGLETVRLNGTPFTVHCKSGDQVKKGQLLMLEDPDYLDSVNVAIEDGAAAAIAALDTGEEFAQVFAAMDDGYMSARSADIRDMSRRLYDILCGNVGFQLPDGEFLLCWP